MTTTRRIPTNAQMEASRKTYFFHFRDDNDDRQAVVVQLLPNGEFGAWLDDDPEFSPGLGDTEMEAICDLRDRLTEEI